jgi:hypothetical protein
MNAFVFGVYLLMNAFVGFGNVIEVIRLGPQRNLFAYQLSYHDARIFFKDPRTNKMHFKRKKEKKMDS